MGFRSAIKRFVRLLLKRQSKGSQVEQTNTYEVQHACDVSIFAADSELAANTEDESQIIQFSEENYFSLKCADVNISDITMNQCAEKDPFSEKCSDSDIKDTIMNPLHL